MTFGGIYREVYLRFVPDVYLDNIFARPKNVLGGHPSLDVDCFLAGNTANLQGLSLQVELRDGDRQVAAKTLELSSPPAGSLAPASAPGIVAPVHASLESGSDPNRFTVSLANLNAIQLWDLTKPQLYTVHVRVLQAGQPADEDLRRIGSRHAEFTDHSFVLDGNVIKLRGLDRHQTFPFVGQAMPGRVQRQMQKSCGTNFIATSSAPRIIRSRGIFSIAVTRLACLS